MKRLLLIIALFLSVLVIGYWAGPTAHSDAIKDEAIMLDPDLVQLEQSISASEQKVDVRPDNEARIIWADSLKKVKTPYSIVYIPGFSASWAEGDPVHTQIAAHFGCNLYLARTAQHGLNSTDAFKDLTPASYAASAERALAIGKALGNNVIVMGTSAGGMLTLYLAAHHPEIEGLILYSPCIAVANPALKLATKPWGKQILDQVFGGEHVPNAHYQGDRSKYWVTNYHTNGLITLQTMLDEFMTPDQFARVKQPVFMGYYYKDEDHQDNVVSVPAMLAMYDELGTPASKKEKRAFPEAGDHVIGSHFTSKDLTGVYRATEKFMNDVLKMRAATTATLATARQTEK